MFSLYTKLPKDLKSKLINIMEKSNAKDNKIELTVLFGDNVDKVSEDVKKIGGDFLDLGFGFGIVTINVDDVLKVAQLSSIDYIEFPKTIFVNNQEANEISCINEVIENYKLSGEGILTGFIDSGIDYLHRAFIKEDNTTRIDTIYDLSLGGKVYDSALINEALKSSDPYKIVPSKDELGHGTHVCGIAAAGGSIDKRYYGPAFNSTISMVKMAPSGGLRYSQSTQLMRGVKYLIDRARLINKPLVINISYSTNDGAHDGTSLLERYIGTVCLLEKITMVISAGNEGDAGHHAGDVLKDKQNLTINIAEDETGLVLQLYKEILDDISIEVINPMGRTSGVVRLIEGYKEISLGDDMIYVYVSGARPLGMNSEIIISLVPKGNFLIGGAWTLTIYSSRTRGGRYDIWMPVTEGLNPKTKFLEGDPMNTLGIPATVSNVISVGSYNMASGSVSSFSGRGGKSYSYIKPELLSPGENIESSIPGGEFDVKSGTSMAAPVVTGASALFMEYGLVKGKDPYLYGNRLKYYLLLGAVRDRQELIYPNDVYGYGKLCLNKAFNALEGAEIGGMRVISEQCGQLFTSEDCISYLVEYDGNIEKYDGKNNLYCAFKLDENYAIFCVKGDKGEEVLKTIPEIVYVEKNSLFTLAYTSPYDAANINMFHKNEYLNLTGKDVIIGVLDTGVNYLNNELTYEDDTTRIIKIWDQTMEGHNIPEGYNFGSEYSRDEINKAILESKKGGDPYKIVPEKDTNGHGTYASVLIGGRGKKPEFTGGAPDSEFLVVKLKEAKKSTLTRMGLSEIREPVYESAGIVLGLKYLVEEAKRIGKPISIYVPMETNMGGHDGTSIVERYIDDASKVRGLVVSVPSGNEGDTETHTEGILKKNGDIENIEFKVDPMQKSLNIQVWCKKPDKVSVGLVSPSGEIINNIPPKLKESQEIKLIFEGSTVSITYYIPEPISGDELIDVTINNIKEGIWQLRLQAESILDGGYDAYMPQRALLKEGTRFIKPSPYTTVTIPGTSKMAITSGAYNQNNNTSVGFSGRGRTRDERIKPDLCAGGVNVISQGAEGETTAKSGTSVSAAVLCAACALMLQWGIVDKNDTTLYSTKIKAYLIRGTTKRKGDIYPNEEWGYGMLNLEETFKNIRLKRGSEESIFIRIPDSMKKVISSCNKNKKVSYYKMN